MPCVMCHVLGTSTGSVMNVYVRFQTCRSLMMYLEVSDATVVIHRDESELTLQNAPSSS